MKIYIILAVLLSWHKSALGSDESSTTSPVPNANDDFKFNARILATDVKPFGNPVMAARKLLYDLGKFSLITEVVQAKFFEYEGSQRLLFEMSNPLQAKSVIQAFAEAEPQPKSKLARTNDDFYDLQMEFRMG